MEKERKRGRCRQANGQWKIAYRYSPQKRLKQNIWNEMVLKHCWNCDGNEPKRTIYYVEQQQMKTIHIKCVNILSYCCRIEFECHMKTSWLCASTANYCILSTSKRITIRMAYFFFCSAVFGWAFMLMWTWCIVFHSSQPSFSAL